MTEQWRDVPGFNGVYQASTEGRIRHRLPDSGCFKLCVPYTKKRPKNANSKTLRVKMQAPDGRWVERPVLKIIAETFFKVPEGMVAVHINGCREDNAVGNIAIMPHRRLGEKYGGNGCRRPVVKITEDGEVLDAYSSACEAGRKNYFSFQAVRDRCNRKLKREFIDLPYSFRWDDRNDDGRYD